MADLFNSFSPVDSEYKNDKLESLIAYEEAYMKLLRNYKSEIAEIQNMLVQVREERQKFYNEKLPIIIQEINNDNVLSDDAKSKWISELRDNMEKSFKISEELIAHYTTKNMDEFKRKMKSIVDKV